MLKIRWAPITDTLRIPPFGYEFEEHLLRYKEQVRKASCSAWGLLETLIKENGLSVPIISFEDNGKPYCPDRSLFFSISHTKELCAAAISDHPIGIDIETRRAEYRENLKQRVMSVEEANLFDGDFNRLWCKKEAISKLTGEGIFASPKEINTLDPNIGFYEETILYGNSECHLAAAYFKERRSL